MVAGGEIKSANVFTGLNEMHVRPLCAVLA